MSNAQQHGVGNAARAEDAALQARAMLEQVLSCSAIGDPATVRESVRTFVERTGADELMVTAQVYDPAARVRSYELLMDALRG